MVWIIILSFSLIFLAIIFSTRSKKPYGSSASDASSDASFIAFTSSASTSGKGSDSDHKGNFYDGSSGDGSSGDGGGGGGE